MKKKISPIQIVRAVIQLIAFVTVPALFITIFSSIGGIITSIAGGSFVLIDNLGRLVLILGVLAEFHWKADTIQGKGSRKGR